MLQIILAVVICNAQQTSCTEFHPATWATTPQSVSRDIYQCEKQREFYESRTHILKTTCFVYQR